MSPRAVLAAALLLLSSSAVQGLGPSWYNCGPDNCAAPDCVCASGAPPAANGSALSREDTPQFIVLTHDDAISATTNEAMRAIIDQHKNRNGCNMPATFFVLEAGTDCNLARGFWEQNSELAIHSKTHVPLTDPLPANISREDEMFSARTFLNETCGIPLEDLVGYRAPQLVHNPPQRQLLAERGMLYDSSIPEFWGPDSQTSPNASDRLWPYTMDAGIPQNCAYFSGSTCNQSERYPGLWEFPLLETQAANGSLLYSMDPGREGGVEGSAAGASSSLPAPQLLQLLQLNFNSSYNGNRSPFGIYVHTPWATNQSIAATNDFLEWALKLPGTYVVTVRQVIEWMQDPVPVSDMDEWLTCRPVDLSQSLGTVRCQVYDVKAGDTGASVAATFGVALDELAALNPDLESLQIGQPLLIPPFDDSCGEGTPVSGPGGAPAPAPA